MKTYYCVKTEFYNNGTVKACIDSRKAKTMPESRCRETAIAVNFIIWFASQEEAEQFLIEAR